MGSSHKSFRFFVMIMASVGMAINYIMRVNISSAIVAMVNTTAQQLSESKDPEKIYAVWEGDELRKYRVEVPPMSRLKDCDFWNITHEGKVIDGPFLWTETQVGFIFSSYYIGYVASLIPGGRIAELWSVKGLYLFAIVLSIIMTMLTPMFTNISYEGLIFVQIVKGIGGGVIFPCSSLIIAHWAPASERSLFATAIFGGYSLGTVVAMAMVGAICNAIGWEWSFYLTGILAMPWCIFWFIFMSDDPADNIWISDEEKKKIADEKPPPKPKLPIPFKAIFTSVPFLAIICGHVFYCCGFYLFLTNLPIYMRQMLNFSMAEVKFLSAIPYLLMFFFSVGVGQFMTSMIKRKKISVTKARKLSTLISAVIPAVCLSLITFMGCKRWATIVLFTISLTAMGAVNCGVFSNHVDLAPNFAGTLMSISGSIGNCAGIVIPMLVGLITQDNQTLQAWRIVFFIIVGTLVVECVVYTIFASGELQWWNEGKEPAATTDTA